MEFESYLQCYYWYPVISRLFTMYYISFMYHFYSFLFNTTNFILCNLLIYQKLFGLISKMPSKIMLGKMIVYCFSFTLTTQYRSINSDWFENSLVMVFSMNFFKFSQTFVLKRFLRQPLLNYLQTRQKWKTFLQGAVQLVSIPAGKGLYVN